MNNTLRQTAVLKSGYGYYDVTTYPYGGCFRRLDSNTKVEVIEGLPKRYETRVAFADGREGVITNDAFIPDSFSVSF